MARWEIQALGRWGARASGRLLADATEKQAPGQPSAWPVILQGSLAGGRILIACDSLWPDLHRSPKPASRLPMLSPDLDPTMIRAHCSDLHTTSTSQPRIRTHQPCRLPLTVHDTCNMLLRLPAAGLLRDAACVFYRLNNDCACNCPGSIRSSDRILADAACVWPSLSPNSPFSPPASPDGYRIARLSVPGPRGSVPA